MAQLTPLAKGLIGVIVLAAGVAVAWNVVKHTDGAAVAGTPSSITTAGTPANPYPGDTATPSSSGAAGSAADMKVSLVSFHGYAPALVANGNSLTTKAGSAYAKQGLNVEFVIQDDIPTLETIFTAGTAQCAWRTSDFWAQEQPNLRNANLDGRAVMIVDNTRGADAVIARDPNIRRIEDLAGKSVALLQFTPSHGMLIDAIENSSLNARQKASIKMVFINVDEGLAGVGAALTSGSVDAAVLWDPDLSMTAAKGAHTIYSTKSASNLIYDVMVCDKRFLDTAKGKASVQKFVAGWMDGVELANADKGNAVEALVSAEPYFAALAKDQGKPFIAGLFNNLVWTGLSENARVFGMTGGTNHYERVYRRFDGIYRTAGALANPKSPVIAPQESVDYSFIRTLLAANQQAEVQAKQAEVAEARSFTVEAQTAAVEAAPATVTKPVTINFEVGSAQLTKRAEKVLDEQLVPFIENNGTAYFEVSGNTDSTGSFAANMSLSKARAQAVVAYLTRQWEFPVNRFRVVGNGPTKPLCDEAAPQELSLEECRASNRTTRVGVFSAQ